MSVCYFRYKGVSTPGGMMPMMKGGMPPMPPATKNGLTMYACNPYQQPMANAASMQPCYHPMTGQYQPHISTVGLCKSRGYLCNTIHHISPFIFKYVFVHMIEHIFKNRHGCSVA